VASIVVACCKLYTGLIVKPYYSIQTIARLLDHKCFVSTASYDMNREFW